jgi:hypothetical protein
MYTEQFTRRPGVSRGRDDQEGEMMLGDRPAELVRRQGHRLAVSATLQSPRVVNSRGVAQTG